RTDPFTGNLNWDANGNLSANSLTVWEVGGGAYAGQVLAGSNVVAGVNGGGEFIGNGAGITNVPHLMTFVCASNFLGNGINYGWAVGPWNPTNALVQTSWVLQKAGYDLLARNGGGRG